MKRFGTVCLILVLLLVVASPAAAQSRCPNGRSSNGAMWFSILHPGLGEYFLNGWGNWNENMPQRKFWLGFIPLYGWPGYLQVVSAIDAKNCRTDDNLRLESD